MIRLLGFSAAMAILTACIALDQPKAVSDCVSTGCVDEPKVTLSGGKKTTIDGNVAMGGFPQIGGVTTDTWIVDNLSTGGAITVDTVVESRDALGILPTVDTAMLAENEAGNADTQVLDSAKTIDSTSMLDAKAIVDQAIVQKELDAAPSVPLPMKLPGPECTDSQKDGYWCPEATTCYSYCGPDKQGHKKRSCKDNKFGEEKCVFANPGGYACYKTNGAKACKSGPPKVGTKCNEPLCQPCGSDEEDAFQDTSGTLIPGFCVCTNGKWSCGDVSREEWPCMPNSPKEGCS